MPSQPASNQTTAYSQVYFAPDLDQSWEVNPGILRDVVNFTPSKRGTLKTYRADSAQAISIGSYTDGSGNDGDFLAGAIFKKSANTGRMIIATTKFIKESDGSSYTNRKTLAASASDFSYTTYGNDIIFCDKANPPQVSSSTTFADLGGSPPKAKVCTTQKNFVILGDTNDGVDDFGDRLWWSGIGNDATWTPSASTQAGNLRLFDTPGAIKALVNLRDAVAVYKEDSLYILDYQGSPLLWTHRLVSDRVGCPAANGVAVVNGIHYFLHRSGVYRFDGASVQPIGDTVNRYVFDKMVSQANFATVQAVYDEYEGLILWYFRNNSSSTASDRQLCLAYNVITNQYGFISGSWTSGGICQGIVKATLSDIYAWKSSLGTSISNVLTIGTDGAGTGGVIRIPEFGTSGSGGQLHITTGDIGNDISNTTITAVKPRLLNQYSTWSGDTLYVYGKRSLADAYDTGDQFTVDEATRRFTGRKSARWLKLYLPIFNYGEIAGLNITKTQSGYE